MKFQRRILASVGLALLLALSTDAQPSGPGPLPVTTHITTNAPPRPTTPSTAAPEPSTQPPIPQTTSAVIRTTTIPPPVRTTTAALPPAPSSAAPSTSTSPNPARGGPCSTSMECPQDQLCAWVGVQPTCVDFVSGNICGPTTPVSCSTHADCTGVDFSYCALGQKICGGYGKTGNVTDCNANLSKGDGGGSGSQSKVLMYAGIGVGSVAVLAVLFALVRWQRRRKRSRMPASMFGEIDYGMSNRNSVPLPVSGNAHSGSGGGGGGGGGGDGGENEYPFSGRPNAQGNTYDDQYYDDGYAQNMHQMNGMGGGKGGEAGYYDHQGYDNNHYDPNYDQGYYNQGYDQGYNNQGGYNTQGGYNNNQGGFYDDGYGNQAGGGGYNQYDAKSTAVGGHTSPIAAPQAAHSLSPRQGYNQPGAGGDHYGVEPSELDFGGQNNHSHNPQYGGGQGYNGRY